MVVRCEVDACVVGSSEVGATADPKQSPPPSSPVVKNKTDSQLTVIPGGSEIPQESLVELTARRKIDWNEKYPQLFLSQTPNIFIASHKDGCVTSIKKRRLEMSDVGAMEQQFQPSLWKLKAALKAIQKLTILHGKNEKLTLICQAHTLRMYKTKSQQSCLPQSVLARFSRRIPTVSRRLIGK